jgi:hypothetical protein
MIAASNAKFFPQDSLWQKHCAMVAAYLEAVSLKPAEKIS